MPILRRMTLNEEKTKALTLRLPASVHRKLKLLSVYEDQTMTDIVIQCIEERFEKHGVTAKQE